MSGQPQGASSLQATSGVRAQEASTSLPPGSSLRAHTTQGSQPARATPRVASDILLNHSSFLQYQRVHQTEAKLLASVTQSRDQLLSTQAKLVAILGDPLNFPSKLSQPGALTDFVTELDEAIQLVDEAVNLASQKMLFQTRQISDEVAVLSGDLDLHNQLNPHNQIDIKRLNTLYDRAP